jgi:hypothetical protein
MKKLHLLLALIFGGIATVHAQSVGIGTSEPDSSAALEISSVDQGILVPRMTSVQRTAISNPANGLLVFDTNTNSFWFKGNVWTELIDSSNTVIHKAGLNIYMGMNGKVGIGTTTPMSKLEVVTPTDSNGIMHRAGPVRLKTKLKAQNAIGIGGC